MLWVDKPERRYTDAAVLQLFQVLDQLGVLPSTNKYNLHSSNEKYRLILTFCQLQYQVNERYVRYSMSLLFTATT